MGRKQRAKNNNVRRERYAVKELVRLKKCLGLIDEKGNEISKEVKEISTVTDAKAIQKRREEKMLVDGEEGEKATSSKELKEVRIVNEKTEVEHVFNAKTMKDQFGNYPVWYKRRDEKKKKKKVKGQDSSGLRRSKRKNRKTLFMTDSYQNITYE